MFDQSVFLNQNISNLISLKRSQRSLNKIWKSNFSVDLKRNLVSESVFSMDQICGRSQRNSKETRRYIHPYATDDQ